MIDLGRYNVLGIQISAVDYDAAVARTIRAARQQKPFIVQSS